MKDEKIILAEDDEAAKFVTGLSGWVDKNGVFWGQLEEMARYASATHKRCEECKEAIIRRGYRFCVDCREKKDIERYSKLERKVWDGESYLYSDRDDIYLSDYQEHIKFLRNLQELRSSGTGHRKGKSYQKISKVFDVQRENYAETFSNILENVISFLNYIETHFEELSK